MSVETINMDSAEFKKYLHEKQPDVPKKSAKDMKVFFDSMSKEILVPKINELVGAVNKKAESSDVYTIDEAHERFDPRYSRLVSVEDANNDQMYITGFCYTGGSEKKCTGEISCFVDVVNHGRCIEFTAENDTITVTCNDDTKYYTAGEFIKIRDFFDISADELYENELEEDDLRFYINGFDEGYDADVEPDYHEIFAISFGQFDMSDLHKYTHPKSQVYTKNEVYTKEEAHDKFDTKYFRLVSLSEAIDEQIHIVGFCCCDTSTDEYVCEANLSVIENLGNDIYEIHVKNNTVAVILNGETKTYAVGEFISLNDFTNSENTYRITTLTKVTGEYEGLRMVSVGQLRVADLHKYTYPKEQVYNKTEIDLFNNGMRSEFYSKEQTYSKDEIYSKEEVNGLFKKVYTKDDVYTKNEVINLHHSMREEFYPKNNTYSRGQIDAYLESIRTEFHPKNNVYTKNEVYAKSEVYTKEEADSLYRKTSDLLLTGYTINTPLVFMVSTQSLRSSGRFTQWVNYPLFKALVPGGEEVEIYLRLGNLFSIFHGKNQIILADDNNAPFFINGFEGYKVTSTTALGDELIKCLPPYMDLYLKYYINQTNVTGE